LRLVSHEGLVTGSQPVVILPPGTAKKHTQIWQYLFIAGCVAVSVFLVMQPNRAAMVPRSTAGLPTVLESQAKDPILGPPIAQVRRLMDDSSLFVKQNKVPEAFRCLDQARALLERMAAEDAPNRLRGDDLTAFRAELKKLGASVGAQLVLLHRKLPKK